MFDSIPELTLSTGQSLDSIPSLGQIKPHASLNDLDDQNWEKIYRITEDFREYYEDLEKLGTGTTGVVRRSRNRKDGKEYAVKAIDYKGDDELETMVIKIDLTAILPSTKDHQGVPKPQKAESQECGRSLRALHQSYQEEDLHRNGIDPT